MGVADIFGVYFPPSDSVYLVPILAVAAFEGRLRLDPTRNNQQRGVRLAADYEIDRWTPERLSELVTDPSQTSSTANVSQAAGSPLS